MKTSRTLITAAAILAIAAPAAAARPSADPATARPHAPQASTPATIAAHKERIAAEQHMAREGLAAPAAPLVDRTGDGGGVPLVLVLIGVAAAGGLGIALLARPLLSHVPGRRAPAGLS